MTEKTLRNSITVAWVVLIVCFIITIFGGKLFNIVFQTKQVLEAEVYIENAKWLQIIIASITSYISFNLYYLAICEKRNFKSIVHVLLIPYFIGVSIAKIMLYNVDHRYTVLIDLVTLLIIPFLLYHKRDDRIIIALILYAGFQLISALAKSLAIEPVIIESFLKETIFYIDIIIMIVLYYLKALYKNIKGG